MRWTKRVSVWPVGLTGGARWAGPIVENGKVVRFHTNWAPERAFPIDMAAFAINLRRLVKERPWVAFNSTVAKGFLEPSLLQQLTTIDELEPVADNCTKVRVISRLSKHYPYRPIFDVVTAWQHGIGV